jgi:hypothetical protein
MGCLAPDSDEDVSFWLLTEGEKNGNSIPDSAQKLLYVMNMTDRELEECLKNPLESMSSKPLSLSEELGITTKFLWLLDQKETALEGTSHHRHTLEDDVFILEQGRAAAHPSLWSCVVYRAGHKRIVRGYKKAAKAKLSKIIAALSEQDSV